MNSIRISLSRHHQPLWVVTIRKCSFEQSSSRSLHTFCRKSSIRRQCIQLYQPFYNNYSTKSNKATTNLSDGNLIDEESITIHVAKDGSSSSSRRKQKQLEKENDDKEISGNGNKDMEGKYGKMKQALGKIFQFQEVMEGEDQPNSNNSNNSAPSTPTVNTNSNSSSNSKSKNNSWQKLTAQPNTYRVVKRPSLSKVNRLAHGLDRVLFSPGVHFLQDPRTKTFTFDPKIQKITHHEDFDYSTIPEYVPPSQDANLRAWASKLNKRYVGSTSTLTNLLSKFYIAISNGRGVDVSRFSKALLEEPEFATTKFTQQVRDPTASVFRFQDNVYTIDQEKNEDEDDVLVNLLSHYGQSLEVMVTTPHEEYQKHLKGHSTSEKISREPDEFLYATMENFLLRSQIDCQHPNLPNKTFDIKTRATICIRMDPEGIEEYGVYRLEKLFGPYESFEREDFDMLRAVFLKFSFQARIGNMDGIFVTYHNTKEIFGFQYVPLEDIDRYLFGNTVMAESAFSLSMKLLNIVLDKVVERIGYGKSFKLALNSTSAKGVGQMKLFAEPIENNQPQEAYKWEIQTESLLNGRPTLDPVSLNADSSDLWQLMYRINEVTPSSSTSSSSSSSSSSSASSQKIWSEYQALRKKCKSLEGKEAALLSIASRRKSSVLGKIRKYLRLKEDEEEFSGLTSASSLLSTKEKKEMIALAEHTIHSEPLEEVEKHKPTDKKEHHHHHREDNKDKVVNDLFKELFSKK